MHLRLARLSGVPFTNRLVTKFDLPVVGWREHARNGPGPPRHSRHACNGVPAETGALPTRKAGSDGMLEELEIHNLGPIRCPLIAGRRYDGDHRRDRCRQIDAAQCDPTDFRRSVRAAAAFPVGRSGGVGAGRVRRRFVAGRGGRGTGEPASSRRTANCSCRARCRLPDDPAACCRGERAAFGAWVHRRRIGDDSRPGRPVAYRGRLTAARVPGPVRGR